MLDDLPSDLLLAIVRNLSLSDVASLRRVSKAWNSFIDQNEFTVFHTAAFLNFHVPPSAELLQDLQHLYSPRALNGVSTWKELCKRLFEINKSWSGITPSTITSHQYTGKSQVHRFKVDEHVALIIATSSFGGLTVTDLNASKWYDGRVRNMTRNPDAIGASAVLWELPKNCVRPYAHCEYGHGYLIFDRFGGSKEVWRLADYDYYYPSPPSSSDETPQPPLTVAPEAAPDFMQKRAGERASARHIVEELPDREDEESPPLRRGHFVPWALLRPEDHTRAFRFVYPILLVASFTTAYLYDVRTGLLIQEIQNLQLEQQLEDDDEEFTEPSLGELSYVEHCSQYVFICGETCLRVFSRQTGQWMYDIPAIKYSYGWSRWKISPRRDDRMRSLYCIRSRIDDDLHAAWNETGSVFYRHELVRETVRQRPIENPIVAAHVSSCGNYLAVLLRTSRVLIIRDLERLFKGDLSLLECTIEVQLGRDALVSRYHAFENGRVAVANRNGIFIVIPDPSFFNSEPLSASSPPPTVLRVHPLNDSLSLDSVTCLQMTQTGLFVNWTRQCPFTVHSPEHSDDDRKTIYAGHEGSFWSQLDKPLNFDLDPEGNMFVEEDDESSRMTSDSIVLSVDFVET